MKVIVIGKGTIGSAVAHALKEKGHEVLSVSRNSGELRADISDPKSLHALFSSVGPFDAVANAAGKVFPGPLEQTTPESVAHHARFVGFIPVPAAEVAQAYLRAMSHPINGRILKLHKIN